MGNLLELFDNLSAERRALLALRLKDRVVETINKQKIPRRKADPFAPLSYGQQQLWFLWRWNPKSPFYNIPIAVRLTGQLNIRAMERTFSEIARRHEALRTTFPEVGGRPVQAIAPAEPLTLPVIDLSDLDEAAREAQALRLATEEARRPFDLMEGPLLRAVLLRLTEREHALLFAMHHIVSDGWSLGVLTREVGVLYEAFYNGRLSPLAELPIQYADFAAWQVESLKGNALETKIEYWKRQLAKPLPVLELPTDRPQSALQTFRGDTLAFGLSKSLTEKIKALSRKEEATPFMFLLAAFQTLLHKYTGQDDIIVGTASANRNHEEIEGLIGFFVNTLALRTDLSGDPTFCQLLGRVKNVTMGAYAHQDVPFEKILEVVRPERDLSRSPIFQASFVFQNTPQEPIEMPELKLSGLGGEIGAAKFDMSLGMGDDGDRLAGSLEYNRDLFDASTIKRVIGHFKRLLESIVENPEQPVSSLQMMSDQERRQLLVEWNDTNKEYRKDRFIHQIIEEQAELTPDSLALLFDDQPLSYHQLNSSANQLAHLLQSLGVGPESLVAVCLHRSADMILALLAVLKAGGGYVPIDPDYPPARLAFMLDDSGAHLLITTLSLDQQLFGSSDLSSVPRLYLDQLQHEIDSQSRVNPHSEVGGENLAYVIYTSGTTGKPKGAMNTHHGISNRLQWMQEAYLLDSSDRVLHKTPLSFDVSVWEVFWPLMSGAAVVVARPGGHLEPGYLVELIEKQEVTTMHFVPSMMEKFLEEVEEGRCKSVRRVIASGEAMSRELVEKYFERMSGELHNLYGPTEASVDVSWWECERGAGGRSVPIGRPIANTQIYILDKEMRAVPVGVLGELYLGGAGLGRGYLRKGGMTAERFVPNPYGGEGGSRIYRSGDIGRYREDGSIEYVGRVDHQVKIRGARIEIGEIESVMREVRGVREAVVVVREEEGKGKELIGYVVMEEGEEVSVREMREELELRLPKVMVPRAIVRLEGMPLSPNGKLDRKALPSPDGFQPRLAEYVAPSTQLEEAIAAIWKDVLGVERIGVNDNFFELGGHSLLIVEMHSRLRNISDKEIPIVEMFRYPTINSLAVYLGRQDGDRSSLEGVRKRANKQKQAMSRRKQRPKKEQ